MFLLNTLKELVQVSKVMHYAQIASNQKLLLVMTVHMK